MNSFPDLNVTSFIIF